jgi:hypothetical protein
MHQGQWSDQRKNADSACDFLQNARVLGRYYRATASYAHGDRIIKDCPWKKLQGRPSGRRRNLSSLSSKIARASAPAMRPRGALADVLSNTLSGWPASLAMSNRRQCALTNRDNQA